MKKYRQAGGPMGKLKDAIDLEGAVTVCQMRESDPRYWDGYAAGLAWVKAQIKGS